MVERPLHWSATIFSCLLGQPVREDRCEPVRDIRCEVLVSLPAPLWLREKQSVARLGVWSRSLCGSGSSAVELGEAALARGRLLGLFEAADGGRVQTSGHATAEVPPVTSERVRRRAACASGGAGVRMRPGTVSSQSQIVRENGRFVDHGCAD